MAALQALRHQKCPRNNPAAPRPKGATQRTSDGVMVSNNKCDPALCRCKCEYCRQQICSPPPLLSLLPCNWPARIWLAFFLRKWPRVVRRQCRLLQMAMRSRTLPLAVQWTHWRRSLRRTGKDFSCCSVFTQAKFTDDSMSRGQTNGQKKTRSCSNDNVPAPPACNVQTQLAQWQERMEAENVRIWRITSKLHCRFNLDYTRKFPISHWKITSHKWNIY